MRRAYLRHAVLVLAGLPAIAAGTSVAQNMHPPSFTEEQVERGHATYAKNCQDCHGTTLDNGEFGGPPLKGSYFRQHWAAGDVGALVGYMSTLMPPDRPGGLSPQSYADIAAFLLVNNGYAAGPDELPADPEALRTMSLKR